MRSNNRYIQEYVRVMRNVDLSRGATQRIIDNCAHHTGSGRPDMKAPAIAAISCAAVAAVAVVGIPKIKRRSDRGGK